MSKPLPTAESPSVLNVSAYRFVQLTDLPALRDELHQRAQAAGLLGTILLAEEGINLMLAGEPDALRRFMDELQADPRFPDLPIKESLCEGQPFRFLKVKIKREIIRMNHPTLRPLHDRAPAVPARTLAKWLSQGHCDEGRPVVMVDTRNAFEVDHGTFENTLDWRISKFSEFPQAVLDHRSELEGKTVVSFCTGGIRCEKAAIYMREVGVERVLQLEGGILRYFEEAGGAHYRGGCFVFDERQALDPALAPVHASVQPA